MTKTKMKTTDGKWFKSFTDHFDGKFFKGCTINLTEKESDTPIFGKVEAKEVAKIARKWCGVELIEVIC